MSELNKTEWKQNSSGTNSPLLSVQNLRMFFHTFDGEVRAVNDVSFDLNEREILGIVGESGSGKTVTSFSIIKLLEESGRIEGGRVLFEGQDLVPQGERIMSRIRGKKISMIFQDSLTSLDPLKTIENQISEMFLIHKPEMSRKERRERCIELLRSVGIPNAKERLKSYPFQLSGGMRQRVVIAIALAIDPKLVIADEPTTALDVTIQAQILRLMKKLVQEKQASLILITHDLAVVSQMADKIVVMYCGKVVEKGSRDQVINSARHPYTVGLLQCIPRLQSQRSRLPFIPGVVHNLLELPSGCYFADRCPHCQERCRKEQPTMTEIEDGHEIACFYPASIHEEIY